MRSQRGPASKVRALEIKPCVDAWDRSIQTRTHRYAAIACFKFDRHPKKYWQGLHTSGSHWGQLQGHLRLAEPLPKVGTFHQPDSEPLLGASAWQNDLAACYAWCNVWMFAKSKLSWPCNHVKFMQGTASQHFQGITVATPELTQKGSALCRLPVGTSSGTSVIWKRLWPCRGVHLETIEWYEVSWMSDTTCAWNQISTICVNVQTASPRLMLS